MDLVKTKSALFSWWLARNSTDPLRRRHEAPRWRTHVSNLINEGLRPTRHWRGGWDSGGARNRSQRKHCARGGTLYRDGFHWLAFGRSLKTGGWLP